jgi:hypothetical protein
MRQKALAFCHRNKEIIFELCKEITRFMSLSFTLAFNKTQIGSKVPH